MKWIKKSKQKWFGYIGNEPAYEVGYDRENGWYYIDLNNDCKAEGYGTATEAKKMAEQDYDERFDYELEIRMEIQFSNRYAEEANMSHLIR